VKEKPTKTKSYRLPELIRKSFGDRATHEKDWVIIDRELLNLCRSYCFERGYTFDEKQVKEIKQETIFAIWKEMAKSQDVDISTLEKEDNHTNSDEVQKEGFWETIDSKSDGQIVNYLKEMIRTSVKNSFKDLNEINKKKIYEDVVKGIGDLVNENELKYMGSKFFALSNIDKCVEYFEYDGSIKFPYVDLRRGETMTSQQRLKSYILEIVTIINSKCISQSDILEVVKNNSNFFDFSFAEANLTDANPEVEDGSAITIPGDLKIGRIDEDILDEMFRKFENKYEGHERLQVATMFILKFGYDQKLEKILLFISENCGWKKNLETVRTRLKDVSDSMGLTKLIEDRKSLIYYVDALVSEMKKRYLPDKVLIELDKI
jgi:hypothetical protein